MAYSIVSIHHLSTYQFRQAEAGFAELSEKDLAPLIKKSGGDYSSLISQLHQGHLVLLTDSPTLPMIIPEPETIGTANNWILNPNAIEQVAAAAKNAYQNRLNMCYRYTMPKRQPSTQSLHPPLPMPPYIPEPPIPDRSEQRPPLNYEYSFEIACSQRSVRHGVGGHFIIERTEEDICYGRWNEYKTEHGIRYTEYLAVNEPKRLCAKVASISFGISPKYKVKVRPKGAHIADEAFIPVTPTVQVGGRQGFPCQGFYYHIHKGQLVQEYRIIGDKDWSYYATRSMHHRLDAERGYNKDQTAILVYWRLNGKVVQNQYLFYLDRQITRDELDNLTPQWMKKHGVKLDVAAMLEAVRQPEIEQQAEERNTDNTPAEPVNHLVAIDPQTGERESWRHIAAQYNLTPLELLKLNPSYDADPMSLAVGHSLWVKKPTPPRKETIYGLPAVAPQTYHQALNCLYDYPARHLHNHNLPVKSLTSKPFVMQDITIVNLRPERTLRIGVFFDGTGQNSPNDQYKEQFGNKARSNIARLYEGYPEVAGESAGIYISGVGTVDDIEIVPGERNPVIDAGDDEKGTGQAFGMFDDTGALWKWQQLLFRLREIILDLVSSGDYEQIRHIEFDVFGFSRGAALARHFVNAVQQGLPDYLSPDKSSSSSTLFPNLMGNERYPRFDARSDEFYPPDKHRRATVRFVGLFDTVGSFYRAGNEKDGEFCLKLKPDAAERVFQICAAHEYRINFPLTSLGSEEQKSTAFIDGIFYQEVFPGCHCDIGGGYPSKNQYSRTDLPERLNIPVDYTYNRHCIKTDNFLTKYQAEMESLTEANAATALAKSKLTEENQTWLTQSQQTAGVHGEVKLVDGQLLYYHFLPVSNALAGLTLERMKQQSALCGVKWDEDRLNEVSNYDHDLFINEMLWESLRAVQPGEISQECWQKHESKLRHEYIHRPHDALINPGYSSVMERLINGVHRDKDNNLIREMYSND
ncbi:DUF2235 domain-containing protein [Vibrio sp. 99-8-1]|uniref:DUF2235 domain-containing protein n=1 Tax=Vibrio sp. 99-8-1 TaxID=2607602 RepID=UPI0014939EF1|nr:DUF2235 domain-containing protein [Vibrio sp. 99-8-1]NOI67321.1 DUF2235 domain-containing protein [Vibrio sp. 99-8-1]